MVSKSSAPADLVLGPRVPLGMQGRALLAIGSAGHLFMRVFGQVPVRYAWQRRAITAGYGVAWPLIRRVQDAQEGRR